MIKVAELSNYQLYTLLQYKNSTNEIRLLLEQEFDNRNIQGDELVLLEMEYATKSIQPQKEKLAIWQKIIVILFPFFILFHSIYTSRYFSLGKSTKFWQYWKDIILGFLLWTVFLLFFFSGKFP